MIERRIDLSDTDSAMELIKILTKNKYKVLVEPDCEGTYMISYISPYEEEKSFVLKEEQYDRITGEIWDTINGERINYVE